MTVIIISFFIHLYFTR